GKIIGTLKSKCSNKYLRYIKNNNMDVSADIWQRNYYDHVIRTDSSLKQICKYIRTNLSTWSNDIENPKNNKSR
ncbi:MAG: transposase, partial [Candidatus Omnitrophica bacterium]|nr:transposase [Candidatus Omnitrophota bacterium]